MKKIIKMLLLLGIIILPINEILECPHKINPKPNIHEYIKQLSNEYKINPNWVENIIEIESNWDTVAISPDSLDIGLMQVRYSTAKWHFPNIEKHELLDPHVNVMVGIYHLSWLSSIYDDSTKIIVAYNMGHRGIKKIKNLKKTSYYKKYKKISEG